MAKTGCACSVCGKEVICVFFLFWGEGGGGRDFLGLLYL